MLFVKVFCLLLFHEALSRNEWHVYVDDEIYKAMIFMQDDWTNMITDFKEIQGKDFHCKYIAEKTIHSHGSGHW